MVEIEAVGTDVVVQFLNTVDVEGGTDALDEDETWAGWCSARNLQAGDRATARTVRDGLREIVDGRPGELPTVQVELSPGPLGLCLAAPSDDAVAHVLVEIATLTATGELSRLKLCPAHDCRWAFVDRSRNRSRTWCDMEVCGNRAKARSFRARRQLGATDAT